MFIISLCIMIITLIMTVISLKSRNKISCIITLKILISAFMIITGTMYLTKMISYRHLFDLDYRLYLFVKSLLLNTMQLSHYCNIFLALYMAFSVVEIHSFHKLTRVKALVLLIPPILFPACQNFDIMYRFFIYSQTSVHFAPFFTWLLKNLKYICLAMFYLYLLIPYLAGIHTLLHTKVFLKRKLYTVEMLCILLVDLMVYYTFVQGMFQGVFFVNVSLFKLPNIEITLDIGFRDFVFTLVLYLIVFSISMLLIFFFGTLRVTPKSWSDWLFDTDTIFNKYVSSNLHVYKNAFLAIGQQTKLAMKHINLLSPSELNSQECRQLQQNLEIIDNISRDYLSSIERNLKQRSVKKYHPEKIDIVDCLNAASQKCLSEEKLKLYDFYSGKSCQIYGDNELLTEAFVNLLINALESSRRAQRDPEIEIGLITEEDFCVVTVKDNGVGINKKDFAKIFRSYYSTKPKNSCGGVGLSYVKNIIAKHRGEINIVSKVGEYALFEIAFPIA